MNVEINNLPDYVADYKYIVATLVDGELWFYGAYNDYDKAKCAFEESTVSRLVVENNLSDGSIKYGHWFIAEPEYLNCSICGHSFYTGCESTSEANQRLTDGDCPNYCPNCGAKMDNVVE